MGPVAQSSIIDFDMFTVALGHMCHSSPKVVIKKPRRLAGFGHPLEKIATAEPYPREVLIVAMIVIFAAVWTIVRIIS